MWPSRRSLRGRRNRERGGEGRGGVREARKIRGIGERGKGTPAERTSLR